MKLMKKVVAMTLSTILAVGIASTAHAEPPLAYSLFGTEKEYGENSIPYGSLYEGTDDDDFVRMGNQYFIVPKSDTISFGNIDFSHNIEAKWWLSGVHIYEMEDGKIGLQYEDLPDKTEKVIEGKEYPVFSVELQEALTRKINSIQYNLQNPSMFFDDKYLNTQMKYSNEPFIILEVTDHDLGWAWYWVYQVVDNWSGPVSAGNGQTSIWVSDNNGWRVQNTDGTYLTNAWYQSQASGLWYYMGADSYMLTNTTTPDGYKVNADGVWVQ